MYNCEHPKNKILTPSFIENTQGSFLHRFSWLNNDDVIGMCNPVHQQVEVVRVHVHGRREYFNDHKYRKHNIVESKWYIHTVT